MISDFWGIFLYIKKYFKKVGIKSDFHVIFISNISLPYSKETLAKENVPKEKERAPFLFLWIPSLHAYAARRLTADRDKAVLSKRRSVIVTSVLTMGLT